MRVILRKQYADLKPDAKMPIVALDSPAFERTMRMAGSEAEIPSIEPALSLVPACEVSTSWSNQPAFPAD